MYFSLYSKNVLILQIELSFLSLSSLHRIITQSFLFGGYVDSHAAKFDFAIFLRLFFSADEEKEEKIVRK